MSCRKSGNLDAAAPTGVTKRFGAVKRLNPELPLFLITCKSGVPFQKHLVVVATGVPLSMYEDYFRQLGNWLSSGSRTCALSWTQWLLCMPVAQQHYCCQLLNIALSSAVRYVRSWLGTSLDFASSILTELNQIGLVY